MKRTNFIDLIKIMHHLRAPGGCPWDRAQTHKSLLKYLIEESREVKAAVEDNDMTNLAEELGDVLLQVLFHSEMAQERGDFNIYDVMEILKRKLIKRHPHVFKKKKHEPSLSPKEVVRRWKLIKRMEKSKG